MAQDNKSKIIIFVLFVMIVIVFATEVTKLISDSVDTIDLEKKKIDCANIKFNILSSTYTSRRLILQLLVTSSAANVSIITIIPDMDEIRSVSVNQEKNRNEIMTATFENVSIGKGYEIYLEGCVGYKKSQTI